MPLLPVQMIKRKREMFTCRGQLEVPAWLYRLPGDPKVYRFLAQVLQVIEDK